MNDELLSALLDGLLHDLRGQLQGLVGVTELLALRESTQLSAQGKQWCERIQVSADKTLDLITGAERLRRLHGRSWSPGRVLLAPMVALVNAELAITEPRLELSYEGDTSEWVWVDQEGLHELLSALVDNSARHASRLWLRCSREVDGGMCIVLEDDGPGIDEVHWARVFEPFYSLDGRLGVGLAAARLIAQAHGGALDYAASDRGARLVLTLPGAPSV